MYLLFAKPGRSSTNDIPYSTFKQNWESDKIESIIIQEDKMLIEGKTKDGKAFSTYSSKWNDGIFNGGTSKW